MSVCHDPIEYYMAAIDSMMNQTYKNWEMIIVNDGDNENDAAYHKYVHDLADDRIIYISNEKNQGIPACMNQVLDIASGDFIAKMDSDDISLPDRLEKQLSYFENHSDCNVLGTMAISFGDSHDLLIDYNNYSQKMRSILLMFRNSGLIHPSAMLRREFMERYNIRYDEHFRKASDYRLWVSCTQYSKIDCLNEVLFLYRRHFTQISTEGKMGQDIYRDEIRIIQLKKLYNEFNDMEKELHLRLCNRDMACSDMLALQQWCDKLIDLNKKKQMYSHFRLKGLLYSEALTALCKVRTQMSRKRFLKLAIHYISCESICLLFYNQIIRLSNIVKKKLFPLTKKSVLQFVESYIEQLSVGKI
jgi:glycosyltransferase involved in cell wall biosynthesis